MGFNPLKAIKKGLSYTKDIWDEGIDDFKHGHILSGAGKMVTGGLNAGGTIITGGGTTAFSESMYDRAESGDINETDSVGDAVLDTFAKWTCKAAANKANTWVTIDDLDEGYYVEREFDYETNSLVTKKDKDGNDISYYVGKEEGAKLADKLGAVDGASQILDVVPAGLMTAPVRKVVRNKIGKEAAEEVTEHIVKKAVTEGIEHQVAKNASKEVTGEIVEKEVKNQVVKEVTDGIVEKEVKNQVAKEVTEEVAEKTIKDQVTKEVVKDAAKKSVVKNALNTTKKTAGNTIAALYGKKVKDDALSATPFMRYHSDFDENGSRVYSSDYNNIKEAGKYVVADETKDVIDATTDLAEGAAKDSKKFADDCLGPFFRRHPMIAKMYNTVRSAAYATVHTVGDNSLVAYASAACVKAGDNIKGWVTQNYKHGGESIKDIARDIKKEHIEDGKNWTDHYVARVKTVDEELGIDSTTRYTVRKYDGIENSEPAMV